MQLRYTVNVINTYVKIIIDNGVCFVAKRSFFPIALICLFCIPMAHFFRFGAVMRLPMENHAFNEYNVIIALVLPSGWHGSLELSPFSDQYFLYAPMVQR